MNKTVFKKQIVTKINMLKLFEHQNGTPLANIAKCIYISLCWSGLFRTRIIPHFLRTSSKSSVPLIIHTHKIGALSTSPDGPRKVVLEEQFPLLLIESSRASSDGHQTHWKVHLLKLNHLESRLANQVGGKIKEGMPEVVHLSSSHSHICKPICLHELHWWSVIGGEVP
ncbi:LOW QUALITY PROTEIN: hypothetical protein TorRG33x02_289400 [Trema orientale]|uniref:Uncharacterized protein n=1 Tax=Trema orientale TaxID=63057 RepID=A0A2P5CD85_TREOI|nr:LOW QUALITY PROTEIN: hypothetical protein TorRG33x02_289400 [Trema orientale]